MRELLSSPIWTGVGVIVTLFIALVGWYTQWRTKNAAKYGWIRLAVSDWQLAPTEFDSSYEYRFNLQVYNETEMPVALRDVRLDLHADDMPIRHRPTDVVDGYRLDVLNVPPHMSLSKDLGGRITNDGEHSLGKVDYDVTLAGYLPSGEDFGLSVPSEGLRNEERYQITRPLWRRLVKG